MIKWKVLSKLYIFQYTGWWLTTAINNYTNPQVNTKNQSLEDVHSIMTYIHVSSHLYSVIFEPNERFIIYTCILPPLLSNFWAKWEIYFKMEVIPPYYFLCKAKQQLSSCLNTKFSIRFNVDCYCTRRAHHAELVWGEIINVPTNSVLYIFYISGTQRMVIMEICEVMYNKLKEFHFFGFLSMQYLNYISVFQLIALN